GILGGPVAVLHGDGEPGPGGRARQARSSAIGARFLGLGGFVLAAPPMTPSLRHEVVIVLDFGSQYSQLNARRIRESHVYCEIHPCTVSLEVIRALAPKAIILSGGPDSVYGEHSPKVDRGVFELGVPILGICYGEQLMAH